MENARCYEAPPRTAEQGDPDSPVPDMMMSMQHLLKELQRSEMKLSSQGRILGGEETLTEPQIRFGGEGRGGENNLVGGAGQAEWWEYMWPHPVMLTKLPGGDFSR